MALVVVPRGSLPALFALVGNHIPMTVIEGALDYRCGDLAIDLLHRSATRAGRPLALHPREFDLLACLARHHGAAVSRARLYELVWRRCFDPGTNVVAVTVSRLRAKVDCGTLPPLIHTAPDGYALADPVAAG